MDEDPPKPQASPAKQSVHTLAIDSYTQLIKLSQVNSKFIRDISDFQYIKQIGKGGFGEVWLGHDLRTGKFAAIKELYATKLTGRNLINFIREVNISCRIKNDFTVPFVGFTVEPPYCIISEYMENGSLFEYSNKKHRKFALSGTHMTMIAIGVAYALADIHRCHIMHRDIKAANILLDKNRLPRVCDFGIARNMTRDRSYTQMIGTVQYLAPEIMSSRNYGTEIDIYAYGCLLFEMVNGHNPFGTKFTQDEIIAMVKAGKRPPLDRKSQPKPLIALIDSCWEHDPAKRPTALQIFVTFRQGKTFFKGCDVKKFLKFVETFVNKEIKAKDNRKARKSGKMPKIASKALVNLDQIISRLESKIEQERQEELNEDPTNDGQEEEEQNENEIEAGPSEILQDSNNPNFSKTLELVFNQMTVKQFRYVWSLLLPYFLDESNHDLILDLMSRLRLLAEVDPRFYEVYARAHVFSALPLYNDEMREASFDLVIGVVLYSTDLIRPPMFRVLGSFLTNMPEKGLAIYQYYVQRSAELPVVDLLISFARTFIETEHGLTYLIILRYLLDHHENVHVARAEKIRPIFTAFCRSTVPEVAYEAFLCSCAHFDEQMKIPYDAIVKSTVDVQMIRACISLMLRVRNFPVSRTLARYLVEQARTHPKAWRVMFLFASQSKEHANLLVINNRWMQYPGSEPMKLFLICFAAPSLRPELCGQGFPIFMRHMAKSRDPEVLNSLPVIVHRLMLQPKLIDTLITAGFFAFLAESVSAVNLPSVYNSCCVVLDAFARVCYIDDFRKYVPILVRMLRTPETASASFAVLVTFSCHDEIAPKLAVQRLVAYFESVKKNPSREKQATIFINNVSKFM